MAKRPELLAPAGDMECLKAAILAGCDAVYIGGNFFGARAFSKNFTNDEIIEAVKYAHLYGVKIYVTVNIIVYEAEVKNFMEYIQFLYENNVDALIIQDIGMIDLVHQTFPDFELHASTQMHIHNLDCVKLLEKIGIKRAVLSRELSLDEIKYIKENTNLSIEVFIHGALCICYSGQCLFSSLIGGRSGNRGTCAQPCRQKYDVLDINLNKKNNFEFNLSTKDLMTIYNIDKLIDSGIDSLKIEGRMKSPIYVYLVVSLYKDAIDSYLKTGKVTIDKNKLNDLTVTFNRMFTKGFISNESNDNFINPFRSNNQGIEIGEIVKCAYGKAYIRLSNNLNLNDGIRIISDDDWGLTIQKMYNLKLEKIEKALPGDTIIIEATKDIKVGSKVFKTNDFLLNKNVNSFLKSTKKIPISIEVEANIDLPLKFTVNDGKNTITKLSSELVAKANNIPVTEEELQKQFSKLGNTIYNLLNITIKSDKDIFISIKAINNLRREAIAELDNLRLKIDRGYLKKEYQRKPNDFKQALIKTLKLEIPVDISNDKYDIIYLEKEQYVKNNSNEKIALISGRAENSYVTAKNYALAQDLGAINFYEKYDVDTTLNIVNSYGVALLHSLGARLINLSYELNDKQISNIINAYIKRYDVLPNLAITAYAKEELMISKFNLLKYYDINSKGYLKDRFDNLYLVKEKDDGMHIYNYKFRKINDIDKYFKMGINGFGYNVVEKDDLKNI